MRDITTYHSLAKATLLDILGQAVTDHNDSLTRLGFLYAERARIEVQTFENSEAASIAAKQREAEHLARPIIEETYRYEALRDSHKAEIEFLRILLTCV